MKVKIGRDILRDKVQSIQGIVDKGSSFPILTHILFTVGKGGVIITGTDNTVSLMQKCEVISVEEEGSTCIPARKLYEILKEAEGDLSLAEREGFLHITFGNSKFKLACLPATEYPAWKTIDPRGTVTFNNADLREMIDRTLYCVGRDINRHNLNGLLFHIMPEDNIVAIVATDGHRLSLCKREMVSANGQETEVIIPRKAAAELRKFLDEDGTVTCVLGANHALFQINDVSLIARLIEGVFPRYLQVIPTNQKSTMVFARGAFVKALRKTALIDPRVRIVPSAKSVAVSSSKADIGESKDVIACSYNGEEIELGFNAEYLLECMGTFGSEEISMHFNDPLSPALVTNNGDTNNLAVIMPMRL